MARPFLEAKHQWERGKGARALAILEDIVSGGEGPALYLPDTFIADRAERPFENVVSELVSSGRHLVIPFDAAIGRLWDAFPAQCAISALDARQRAEGDAQPSALALLDGAARDGLLSRDMDDYGGVGKVVLRDEDQPALAAVVDGADLEQRIRRAADDGAWRHWAEHHADLVADLFLYVTFHRVPVMDRSMVLDVLDRVAAEQPEALDVVAEALAARADDGDTVTVGMRLEGGGRACLDRLVEALRRRDFARFADHCLLD